MQTEAETLDQAQETPAPEPSRAEVFALLQKLQAQLEEVKNSKAPAAPGTATKTTKADPNKKYILLMPTLEESGKIPQQQRDLAAIISASFETDVEIPEPEFFAAIVENAPNFPSLAKSKQDPTYLFRYYRGLKAEGNHAGFVARGFLRMV